MFNELTKHWQELSAGAQMAALQKLRRLMNPKTVEDYGLSVSLEELMCIDGYLPPEIKELVEIAKENKINAIFKNNTSVYKTLIVKHDH